LSVAAAAAAVAAAAAESAFTKLASRPLLRLSCQWGWVGVSVPVGPSLMLPALAHTQVVCDRVQVGHIGLGGAESRGRLA
jgi:hypothetical protein